MLAKKEGNIAQNVGVQSGCRRGGWQKGWVAERGSGSSLGARACVIERLA